MEKLSSSSLVNFHPQHSVGSVMTVALSCDKNISQRSDSTYAINRTSWTTANVNSSTTALKRWTTKIKIVKNYLCNCNFMWCTKTRPHWGKKKTGERHNQQTRFWCVLSSDDCTGFANTMSSTACRQKPWQALIPSATSPAYLRLCKISVFYFHAKEILVTAFFLCGEMCITCAGYLWWYKMPDLAEHPSPRGWQAAGHWGGLVVPLSALPGLPPTEGPGKGRNIPVGITIHSVTCSPSITGRSWCISNPFPQRILFSTSSSSPLFYGF